MYRKKDKIISIIIGFAISAVLFTLGTAVYFKIKSPATEVINNTEMLEVVVAKDTIVKGENITEEKLEIKKIPIEYLPSNSLVTLEQAIGKKANFSIEKNSVITDSFVNEKVKNITEHKDDSRLKNCVIETGLIGGMVQEGSYIDVEYVRPNGKRYIVLSKKYVTKKIDERSIVIETTDADRTLIEAAMAEANFLGGQLKTTLYLDPDQKASVVDYTVPNFDVTTYRNNVENNIQLQIPQQPIVTPEPEQTTIVEQTPVVEDQPLEQPEGGRP
ncbi:MAG TPA: hypothetical protein GXX73_14095 [Clostridium sp.]|nr:hypothetical protein [Clostridium sp.]